MYILVVDDDPMALDLVQFILRSAQFEVAVIDNSRGALALIERRLPDLLLLDVKLPGTDGFTFSERLTREGYEIPLIYITACASLDERIRGFELGAQDFICKPYYPQELLKRVLVAARLLGARVHAPGHVRAGSWELIPEALQVMIDGRTIVLTPVEMQVLAFLMAQVACVVKREQFLMGVWRGQPPASNNLDVVIGHLRRKLGASGKQIVCVRGVGYRLQF